MEKKKDRFARRARPRALTRRRLIVAIAASDVSIGSLLCYVGGGTLDSTGEFLGIFLEILAIFRGCIRYADIDGPQSEGPIRCGHKHDQNRADILAPDPTLWDRTSQRLVPGPVVRRLRLRQAHTPPGTSAKLPFRLMTLLLCCLLAGNSSSKAQMQ